MSAHVRNTMLAFTAAVAVLIFAGAGLGLAMPSETGDPAPFAEAWLGLPDLNPVGPGPLVGQPILPEPQSATLRAEELNEWVDDVLEAVPAQESVWDTIDACMVADMAGNPDTPADDTPAASIAVAVDGVITYTKGYGVKDVQAGGEVDAETMFRIGSTTKMMTAAAIMQLREKGDVSLDEPLPTYLPEYRLGHPWDPSELTLHRLMSHQTGIIDQFFIADTSRPLLSWVQAVGSYSLPLYAAPGSYWNYANPNFSLAGAVVERQTGQMYNDYMKEHVWGPAGMPLATVYSSDVISHGNYVTGYNGGQEVPVEQYDMPMLAPAGTAWSTPSELVTWTLMLQNEGGDVMNRESARLMQERHINTGYGTEFGYGYGVMINAYRDISETNQIVTVYDHGGNIGGGSSQLFWVPERGVAFSILANTIRSLQGAAMCTLRVVGELESVPDSEEPPVFDAHVGTYSMMDLFTYPWTGRVRTYSDTLRLSFDDVPGTPMLFGSDMQMYHAFDDVYVAGGPSMVAGNVDFAFIADSEDASRSRYMRNRNLVGQKVGQFPASVTVEGESCAPVSFKSELDMPVLSIDAVGLVTTTQMLSVPVMADDPQDPSSATIRYDMEIGEGGAKYAYFVADTQPDDAVGVYLVFDANEDGDFTLDEIVGEGRGTLGRTIMYAYDPLPAGDYQLWVWGALVQGEDSVFDLRGMIAMGDNLTLKNRPRGLSDGAEWTMEVCAEGMGDTDVPMIGTIQFEYDSPPRLFRIMVDWQPAQEPEPTTGVFLPFTVKGNLSN